MIKFEKDGNRIFFIHVPKTAGTSLTKFLVLQGWAAEHTGPKYPMGGHSEWNRTKIELERENYNGELIFLVYRKSIDRFCSAWRMTHIDIEHQQKWAAYANLDINIFASRVFFDYIQNNNVKDNHIRPTMDFIPDESYENVKIINFEDLSKIPNWLNKEYNISFDTNIEMPHKRRSDNIKLEANMSYALQTFLDRFYYIDLVVPGYYNNRFVDSSLYKNWK